MKLRLWILGLVFLLALGGCATAESEWQDGYYTAEATEYDIIGWKKFVTLHIRDGQIRTVEYDALDRSGFLKSWDMDYMRDALNLTGTYPSQYARTYTEALVNRQSLSGVDAVTGATHSYDCFKLLCDAAIEQARAGDKTVAYVALPQVPYEKGTGQ